MIRADRPPAFLLDRSRPGHVALRQTGWVVGLVDLVFPTVFSAEAEFRFPRVACPEREPSLAP